MLYLKHLGTVLDKSIRFLVRGIAGVRELKILI